MLSLNPVCTLIGIPCLKILCFVSYLIFALAQQTRLIDLNKSMTEYCSGPQFAYVSHPLYQRSPPAHCSTDDEDTGARSPPFEVSEGEEDHDPHLPSTSTSITGEGENEGLKDTDIKIMVNLQHTGLIGAAVI